MWLREFNNPTSTPDQIKTSGSDWNGNLGNGLNIDASRTITTPFTVSVNGATNLSVKQFTQIAPKSPMAVLLNDNTLWTWGRNDSGQLAQNSQEGFITAPTKVKVVSGTGVSDLSVSQIIYGDEYGGLGLNAGSWVNTSFYVKGTDGYFYAAGVGDDGQLGNGETVSSKLFKRMI
jgi:alpha-tubulin suppressor-like RCC1 family protein